MKLSEDRPLIIVLAILLAVGLGLHLLAPFATRFCAKTMHVGLWAIAFSGVATLLSSLLSGRISKVLDNVFGFCVLVVLAAAAAAVWTLLSWLLNGSPPSLVEAREEWQAKAEEQFSTNVRTAVKLLVEGWKGSGAAEMYVRDKIKIFEADDNHPSITTFPHEFGYAQLADSAFTVVFVDIKGLRSTGHYGMSDMSATRAQYDVYLINWPERTVLGMHSIISDPPLDRPYSPGMEQVGDPNDVHRWLAQLPKESSLERYPDGTLTPSAKRTIAELTKAKQGNLEGSTWKARLDWIDMRDNYNTRAPAAPTSTDERHHSFTVLFHFKKDGSCSYVEQSETPCSWVKSGPIVTITEEVTKDY